MVDISRVNFKELIEAERTKPKTRAKYYVGRPNFRPKHYAVTQLSNNRCKCQVCGKIFNPNIKSEEMDHSIYHTKLLKNYQDYGTCFSIDECKQDEAKIYKTFKNSEDWIDRTEAALDLVVVAYSRHLLNCLNSGIEAAGFLRYCREWVEANIGKFPKDLREFISEQVGTNRGNWLLSAEAEDFEVEWHEKLELVGS